MKWQTFLIDSKIDMSFGYQPPEKHLFGKMVHDVLESQDLRKLSKIDRNVRCGLG